MIYFIYYKNSSKISKSVIVKVNRNNVKTIRTQEQAVIPVDYESQSFKLLYILLKEINQIYCGECLSKLRLKWDELFSMNCESRTNLDNLLDKYKEIFFD